MFTPPVSMTIDLATLAYCKVREVCGEKEEREIHAPPGVTALVPAYNEEWRLRRTVESILHQTHPVDGVYILDDMSNQDTQIMARMLAERNDKVYHLRQGKNGKAGNINLTIQKNLEQKLEQALEEMIFIVDGDVTLEPDCVEKMLGRYSPEVDIITGHGETRVPKRFLPRFLHKGEHFANNVFSFRKHAQEKRHAIGVICGAVSMYRRSLLEELPIPDRTETEDTDYTWLAQERGAKIAFAEEGYVIGGSPGTLKAYVKRYDRWMSGTFQSLYLHGRELAKNKSLCYSTILPSSFEATTYSAVLTALPAIAYASPEFAAGVLAADLILTLPWLGLYDKGLVKGVLALPQIYAFKFFTSAVTTYAALKTTAQYALGKRTWSNTWNSTSE